MCDVTIYQKLALAIDASKVFMILCCGVMFIYLIKILIKIEKKMGGE